MVFKTACGLYVKDKAYDDTHYLGRRWVWCHCPYAKRDGECDSRIPYRAFNHCEPQPTDEPYVRDRSVERELEKIDEQRWAALKAFYAKHGDKFKRCRSIGYDRRLGKVKVRYDVSDCMDCERCALINGDEEAEPCYKVVCDVTVTTKYDSGDIFGEQTIVEKHERHPLQLSDKYHTEAMCRRYIKNRHPEWIYHSVDSIAVNGVRWGSLRDIFLTYHPNEYFASRGWISGEITVETSSPYLYKKASRKPANLALLAKAQKEAKKAHRQEIYRQRFKRLIRDTGAGVENDGLKEIRQAKLAKLAEKYPELYSEEIAKIRAAQTAANEKNRLEAAQTTLF